MSGFQCCWCGTEFDLASIKNKRCETCHAEIDFIKVENKSEFIDKFKIGDIVSLVIVEHPWYKKVATVCEIDYNKARIDISGKKLWVPNDWIAPHDFN